MPHISECLCSSLYAATGAGDLSPEYHTGVQLHHNILNAPVRVDSRLVVVLEMAEFINM